VTILLISALLVGCAPKSASAPEPAPTQTQVSTPAQTPTPNTTPTQSTIVWTKPSAPVTLTVDTAANQATYTSGGTQVSGYFYKPEGTGPFPALLLLHGKSGLTDALRPRAASLAAQGYVAFAPDYFTPIGMTPEKFTASFYTTSVDPAREVLGNGLEALKALSYVDAKRLGVVGFSLGGYLALIMASRDDVKDIASYYGAYAPTLLAPRYPLADIVAQINVPVLMFHGDKDELVPIGQANTAQDLLTKNDKQYEYYIYPGVGHAFDIQGGPNYNAQATADAEQKLLTFLKLKIQ
jgi:carboxymethylenebutenolidase